MSETTYYQRNREVILNRAKEYYRNNRDELKVREINIENFQKKKKI